MVQNTGAECGVTGMVTEYRSRMCSNWNGTEYRSRMCSNWNGYRIQEQNVQ